ncbi:Uncharacterised protein [Mycobacteroides abscessus]|nr:Uncharacterised protein [Mycobacteroides abscessus]
MIVTSLSTPMPASTIPHSTTPRMESSGAYCGIHRDSSDVRPVMLAAPDPHQPSTAVSTRPTRVPSSAVDVRAVNPCATYSTTNMTSDDVTSATPSAFCPVRSAGSVNDVMTTNAPASPASAASPRHRATASTTTAYATARTPMGSPRSKSMKT